MSFNFDIQCLIWKSDSEIGKSILKVGIWNALVSDLISYHSFLDFICLFPWVVIEINIIIWWSLVCLNHLCCKKMNFSRPCTFKWNVFTLSGLWFQQASYLQCFEKIFNDNVNPDSSNAGVYLLASWIQCCGWCLSKMSAPVNSGLWTWIPPE